MESRPDQRGTCEAVGAKGAADAKRYGAEFGGKFADDGRGLRDVFDPYCVAAGVEQRNQENDLRRDDKGASQDQRRARLGARVGDSRGRGAEAFVAVGRQRRVEEYSDGASTERVGNRSVYQRRHRNAHLRARGDSCDWKGATCVLVDLGKGVANLSKKRGNLGLHWCGGQTVGCVSDGFLAATCH